MVRAVTDFIVLSVELDQQKQQTCTKHSQAKPVVRFCLTQNLKILLQARAQVLAVGCILECLSYNSAFHT